MGNAATVNEVRKFARRVTPTILCVLETQVHKKRVEGLSSTLGYDRAFAVSSSGRSGGLGIFWNNEINVETLPYSQYHIDAIITEQGCEPWRLTCVYGEATTHLRFKTWDMLKYIKSTSALPWVCMGDFNEVLHRSEHVGVRERSHAQIAGFRDMVDVCGIRDLGYEGRRWTFEKRVAGGSYCRVRLDRALATVDWCSRFPMARVQNLTAVASDHGPILLTWAERPERGWNRKTRGRFQYELMWERHDEFAPMVDQAWQADGKAATLQELQHKLSSVAGRLAGWGKQTFGKVTLELSKLNGELERLQSDPMRLGPSHAEIKITDRIVELNHREEIMWQQRSRIQWLTAGDKNTKFFHLRASQRKKRNKISKLKRPDGSITEDDQEMGRMTTEFYKNLYTSEGTRNMVAVLETVPVKVTGEMNDGLLKPFGEKEVKEALFQMFPTKAPGPDGFPAHFFQRHWDLCGAEVTSVVMRVLRGEDDPSAINNTFVVLIPKVASPDELGQFRRISLSNVIYKIASKVVANRLKVILPEIISEEQSAFVPGRLITDNIITAYECLHFMKRKRAKEKRCCALKLDMRKAYDRVEWSYLRAIMIRLGFHRLWVEMVMRLVTTVSFSVLLNGDHLDSFLPSRGIRQGDPISPYLFLLAAEGLSCLLKSRNQSSNLSVIKVAPSAPMVSHLLFADDSLLFFKANRESALEVKEVLQLYCDASGQQVNMDKSSIHFAKGCHNNVREEIKDILQVHNVSLSEKYLGMPSDVGNSVNGAFKYLKDRVWKKVQGWMEMLLSAAGKEVLIKSVAQAVPTFSMSCFRLPRGLCHHLDGLLQNFWWGCKDGKRKTCWVAWDDMTKPKYMGGLGFRDFELFNLALLARQAWRIVQEPDTLSARILKAVYYPSSGFLVAELGASPSRIWRAIIDGKEVLKQGLIRRIGTG